tara:strand:+ start:7878 stop:8096 length:219 start_codon:yes stop_codon:yes gene_type:complete
LHDTVWFEIQGTPAVSIASTEFIDAATAQAEALGMATAKRVFVEHPIQDANDQQMQVKADAIVTEVIAALTA